MEIGRRVRARDEISVLCVCVREREREREREGGGGEGGERDGRLMERRRGRGKLALEVRGIAGDLTIFNPISWNG